MSNEPAITIGAIVSVIVALAGIFHIVIDANTVTVILTAVAPILSAILIRFHVTPVKKV